MANLLRNNILILIAYAFLGFLLYQKTLMSPFVFDDISNILENPAVWKIQHFTDLLKEQTTRFIPYFTFSLNYHFSQINPQAYHVFNVIVHIINAFLVYILSRILFAIQHDSKKALIFAVSTGLIFLTHPLQTEAVSYVVQRITSISSLFYFLTILLFIKNAATHKQKFYYLSVCSGFLAIFTKETVFVLPAVLFFIDKIFNPERKTSVCFKRLMPFILFSACIPLFLYINIHQGRELQSVFSEALAVSRWQYCITQFHVICRYIYLYFIPIGQNLDYDYVLSSGFLTHPTFLSFGLLSSLGALGIYFYTRNKIIFFGVFWMFINLSIESSFIPIRDFIQERRMYLPMFGMTLVLIEALNYFMKSTKAFLIVISIFAAILSFLTYQRNLIWQSPASLWEDIVKKSPNKSGVYESYGTVLMQEGRLDDAEHAFKKALNLGPGNYKVYNNLGLIAMQQKDRDKAAHYFQKSLAVKEENYETFNNLGAMYLNSEEFDDAKYYFQKAITLNQNSLITWLGLAGVARQEGNLQEAEVYLQQALRIQPHSCQVYLEMADLKLNGKQHYASKDLVEVLRFCSDEDVLVQLAVKLIIHRHVRMSLDVFEHVFKRAPDNAVTYLEFGKVLANLRRYKEASRIWKMGLEKFPSNKDFEQLLIHLEKIPK